MIRFLIFRSKSTFQLLLKPARRLLATTSPNYVELATNYLSKFNDFNSLTKEELNSFYSDNVKQIEFPNTFAPNGRTRTLQEMLDGFDIGKQLLSSQSYDIKQINQLISNDGNLLPTVLVQLEWNGTLGVDVQDWKKGHSMTADIAMLVTFDQSNKVIEQKEYTCYHP